MCALPKSVHKHVQQAFQILVDVGMPSQQQNERTALVLLALAGLEPNGAWSKTSGSICFGITEMMDWMRSAYGKDYAPNSRETVRRFSVHQMISAGLMQQNRDGALAVNSPVNRYNLTPEFAALLSTYGTTRWASALEMFRAKHGSLAERYANEREMEMIPVRVRTPTGKQLIQLTAGGQNPLIKAVIEEFAARFTPGAYVAYVGDTGEKHVLHDRALLESFGISVDDHGKMPDVILTYQKSERECWLVLVEAVTSHGPMSPKRVDELRKLFAGCPPGMVFVTAFPDRVTMTRYLREIAWETEVWIADNPTHLIHFNGDRFLGPHNSD
jgi:hypothetical protein